MLRNSLIRTLHGGFALLLSTVGILVGLPADDVVLVPGTAEYGGMNVLTGEYHLWENVDIPIPGLGRLQCDDFTGTGADTNATIRAFGNVRIQLNFPGKGNVAPLQILAFADDARYTGTNGLLTLTSTNGSSRVVGRYGTITGAVIQYNVTSNTVSVAKIGITPDPTMLTNLLKRARPKAPAPAESK